MKNLSQCPRRIFPFFILITFCDIIFRTDSLRSITHCVKNIRIWSYSGPYFPAFEENMERYRVSLLIQSKCRKVRTKITPNTDTFHTVTPLVFGEYLRIIIRNILCLQLDDIKFKSIFIITLIKVEILLTCGLM